ncbi:MAG: mannonate dehydratase [Candidatus Latescibacterota bacterium]
MHNRSTSGRRYFGKRILSGAVGLPLLAGVDKGEAKETAPIPGGGIKPAVILSDTPTDEQLAFAKAIGAEYIEQWLRGNPGTVELEALRKKVELFGLHLWSVDILEAYNSAECVLGLEGRDGKISQLREFIRNLGKTGLHTTTLAWYSGAAYSTGVATVRGGCATREFDLSKVPATLFRDREFTDEEVWENLKYFLDRVLPVAEESGVRLAFHPGDPPVSMQGCPSILRSTASYDRLLEIGNHSEFLGAAFCVGTWGEMPGKDGKGEDIPAAIRRLGAKHIFTVHYRNVSSPLPKFHETFVDEGYIDMFRVMKALKETGFSGTVVPDHVPILPGEKRLGHMTVTGEAYTLGAIRMAIQAVNGGL